MKTEDLVLNYLINSEEYTRKCFPFLKDEYFHDTVYRHLYTIIEKYINKYNSSPIKEALSIELDNSKGLTEDQRKEAEILLESICTVPEKIKIDYSVDITEKWCQDKAIHNAILTSYQIISEGHKTLDKGAIPKLLSDAISITFDSSIGHDFIDNALERYEFYNSEQEKIPFDLDILNKITGGGLPNKTLTVLVSGTGVGKSLCMCHMASYNLMVGKNVLYITLEMAEEKIARRIDANLLNIPINKLASISQAEYKSKIDSLKGRVTGKLIIKEYPTASASAANFRHLITELRVKKDFVPDIIYVDYLGICASSRVRSGQANSYSIVKSITEEIRGLATEFDLPIVSGTQFNRNGMASSDASITDLAESMGISHTVDILLAISATEDIAKMNQILFTQLKNRDNDVNYYKRFVVGVDKARMKLYDVEGDPQDGLVDAGTNKSDNSDKFNGWS